MAIRKLESDDEDKEIAFELDYLMSLTTRQRFELMFEKTREMRLLLGKSNEGSAVTEIIKREPDELLKQSLVSCYSTQAEIHTALLDSCCHRNDKIVIEDFYGTSLSLVEDRR